MKLELLPLSLPFAFTLYLRAALGSAIDVNARKCDAACAAAMIQQKPNPRSFCSSYLYPHGAPTRTSTITASRAATATGCTTVTRTVLSTYMDVFSDAASTTILPVITVTQYTSTVVIATGPTPVINKRDPLANPDSDLAAPNCKNLEDCIVSSLCSAIYHLPTSTVTVTPSPTKQCKVSETTTVSTRLFTEITRGVATGTPPAVITTVSGTLTTRVPAACVLPPYTPPSDIKGDFVLGVSYPFFPQTPLECCTLCFRTTNCVASAFSTDLTECQLLLVQNGSTGLDNNKSGTCPKGVQDLVFIRDDSFGENTFVGPCGK